MSLMKSSCLLLVAAIATLTSSLGAQSPGLLFENGWENRTDLGCGLQTLLDGSGGTSGTWWNDFGPSYPGLCNGTPPVAQIVNNERHDGNRSLQVNFVPNAGSQNGPDFRIIQSFGNRQEIYARWYVKYSNNWVWASADHKVAIFGTASGTQDVYFNVRGNGNGGTGRVVVHIIPADGLVEDRSTNMAPGVWHLCEIRIRSGVNGLVQVKLDGQLLNLTGNVNPNNVNTGSTVGSIKLDTTYNAYSYPTSLGRTMQTWFDSVAISANGWIGGTNSSSPAPGAPQNLRISGS